MRAQGQLCLQRGIHAVPASIIHSRQLISGGEPPEAFGQALRQLAAAA